MKKLIVLTTILISLSSTLIYAQEQQKKLPYSISSVNHKTDEPIILLDLETDENLVLARETGVKLGYDVKWNELDKSISFIKDDKVFKAFVDSNIYTLNDEQIIDTSETSNTLLVNGKTFVPTSFIDFLCHEPITEEIKNKNYSLANDILISIENKDYFNVCKLASLPTTEEIVNEVKADFETDSVLQEIPNSKRITFNRDKYTIEQYFDAFDGKCYVITQDVIYEDFNVIYEYIFTVDGRLVNFSFEKI